jgi:hypothetical protein
MNVSCNLLDDDQGLTVETEASRRNIAALQAFEIGANDIPVPVWFFA